MVTSTRGWAVASIARPVPDRSQMKPDLVALTTRILPWMFTARPSTSGPGPAPWRFAIHSPCPALLHQTPCVPLPSALLARKCSLLALSANACHAMPCHALLDGIQQLMT